ncbi:hypothetical protein D3C72_2342910 [compost metagenome]
MPELAITEVGIGVLRAAYSSSVAIFLSNTGKTNLNGASSVPFKIFFLKLGFSARRVSLDTSKAVAI